MRLLSVIDSVGKRLLVHPKDAQTLVNAGVALREHDGTISYIRIQGEISELTEIYRRLLR